MNQLKKKNESKDLNIPEDIGGMSGKELVRLAEEMGEMYQGNKTQVRKIYNDIKKIQHDWKAKKENDENVDEVLNQLHLLKPKIAYAAARKKNMRKLKEDLEKIINNLKPKQKDIKNFFELMEAFIAYHAYYSEVKK